MEKRLVLAKEFVRQLQLSLPSGFNVQLDDYGDYSFSLFILLPVIDSNAGIKGRFLFDSKVSLQRVTATAKAVAKNLGDITNIVVIHPKRQYREIGTSAFPELIFEGYDKDSTKVNFEIHT